MPALSTLRDLICQCDPSVSEYPGSIMQCLNAYRYEQRGIFKYGLATFPNHVTFHSMVMYAYPAIWTLTKQHFPQAKIKKGCINFPNWEAIDPALFKEILLRSAQQNFAPIQAHDPKRAKTGQQ